MRPPIHSVLIRRQTSLATRLPVAGQLEMDLFQFWSSTGIEYMWGSQCNQVSHSWQVFDQLNGHWETSQYRAS